MTCRRPWIIVWLVAAAAAAGSERLPAEWVSVRAMPMAATLRPDAPASILVELENNSGTMLNGRLELFVPGAVPPLLVAGEEMALSPGRQRRRIMLPPAHWSIPEVGTMALRGRFVCDNGHIDLGGFTMPVAGNEPRGRLVLACGDGDAELEALRLYVDQLRLRPGPAATLPTSLSPTDLPEEPLELCGWDLLVIGEHAWRGLSPPQSQAVLRWVRAGGTAVLFVAAAGDPRVADLVEAREPDAPSAADPADRWELDLGRLISRRGPVGAVTAVQAGQDAAFVWGGADPAGRIRVSPAPQLHLPFVPQIPGTPWKTIVAVLVCLAVAVGPAEFLVLRWMGRPRWTLLFFPLMVLAATVLMVPLAGRRLPHRQEVTVTVHDVGDGGRIIRNSRLGVTLSPHRLNLRRPVSDGWYVSDAAGASTAGATPGWYSGVLPRRYVVTESMEPRKPLFWRQTSIPGDQVVTAFDAAALDRTSASSSDEEVIASLSSPGRPFEGTAWWLQAGGLSRVGRELAGSADIDLVVQWVAHRSRGRTMPVDVTGGRGLSDLAWPPLDSGRRLLLVGQRQGGHYIVHRRQYRTSPGDR